LRQSAARCSRTSSSAAVTVNLATRAVSGGDAQGDTISGFEDVIGSRYSDHLTGSAGVNRIGGGADTLRMRHADTTLSHLSHRKAFDQVLVLSPDTGPAKGAAPFQGQ